MTSRSAYYSPLERGHASTGREVSVYFDGETYEPEHDKIRLTGQLGRVYQTLQDGQWHTLEGIAEKHRTRGHTDSLQGLSARLRDLRKPRFGSHTIERKRLHGGTWVYRLVQKGQLRLV